ncbi:glycosyltransferase family 4 protein [Afipia sp. TerB]
MTTDTVGGVWTYSTALAAALAQRGAEIHLVTMGPPARADQRAAIRDRRIRLIETGLALEWQDPAGDNLAEAERVLTELETATAPDLVHLNSFREATFDWDAPVLVVAHSCVNSWARACGDVSWLNEPRWRHYTRKVAAGLDAAQAWVSPSHSLRHALAHLYQPRLPGTVIRNGIARSPSPKPKKNNLILAAGRLWDRAKNMTTLADAAAGLDWPLAIAGPDTPDQRNMVWLGHLPHDDLYAVMQHAAIFVSPALYEPFGLSVLEAASAGCAMVLSDIPTFRELWDDAAIFVDPRDAKEIHRVLTALCSDDSQRTALQHAAILRARRYSLSRATAAYRQLYETMLTPRTTPIELHREMHA